MPHIRKYLLAIFLVISCLVAFVVLRPGSGLVDEKRDNQNPVGKKWEASEQVEKRWDEIIASYQKVGRQEILCQIDSMAQAELDKKDYRAYSDIMLRLSYLKLYTEIFHDPNGAHDCLEKLRPFLQLVPENSDLLGRFYHHFVIYFGFKYDLFQAEFYFRRSLDQFNRSSYRDSSNWAMVYLTMGNILQHRKFDLVNADTCYTKAWNILDAYSGSYALPYQRNILLFGLAEINRKLKNYRLAGSYARRLIEEAYQDDIKQNTSHSFVALSYQILGNIALDSAHYQDAIHNFDQAMLCQPDIVNTWLGQLKIDISKAYRSLGDHSAAIKQLNEAISLLSPSKEPYDGLLNMTAMRELGDCLLEAGRGDEALVMYKKTFKGLQADSATCKRETMITYDRLGDYYARYSLVDSALAYYDRSIALGYQVYGKADSKSKTVQGANASFNLDLMEILSKKGSLLESKFQNNPSSLNCLREAWHTYLEADSLLQSAGELFELNLFSNIRGERIYTLYDRALQVAYTLYKIEQDPAYAEAALYLMERSRAYNLLKTYADNTHKELPEPLQNERIRLTRLIDNLDLVLKKSVSTLSSEEIVQLNKTLAELYEKRKVLLAKIKSYSPPDFFMPKATLLSYLRSSTGPQQLASSYYWGKAATYAVSFSGFHTRFIKVDRSDGCLDTMVNRVAFHLKNGFREESAAVDFQDYSANAYGLYLQLVAPLLPAGKLPHNWTISTDGPLSEISFDALLTQAPKPSESKTKRSFPYNELPYLLETAQINYTFSYQLLYKQILGENNAIPRQALAYAYNQASDTLGILGTSTEMQMLRQYLYVKERSGKQASKERFLQEAQDYPIIHLAIHGDWEQDSTQPGFLLFPSALGRGEALYPHEIHGLDIKARLIVLSACQSGRGNYVKGEGVYSIARSFMQRGNPSVVMSLWDTPDATGAVIIGGLYKQLNASKSVGEALTIAKREFLHKEASLRDAHPSNWAFLVCTGNPNHYLEQVWYKNIYAGLLTLVF